MPRYTLDLYAVVTVEITAPSEAAARKMLDHDDYGQELEPCGGRVALSAGRALPLPTDLLSLSYRKVWTTVCVVDDNGTLTDGAARPGDGPVPELEALREQQYCASEDCLNLLDDGEGWEGYCGTCADMRAANEAEL